MRLHVCMYAYYYGNNNALKCDCHIFKLSNKTVEDGPNVNLLFFHCAHSGISFSIFK